MRNGTGFKKKSEREKVIEKLDNAVSELLQNPGFISLVPKIGTNIVYALSHASSVIEVAGLRERIHNISKKKKIVDDIEFGASLHMATVVLEAIKKDPSLRAAINLRGGEDIVIGLEKIGIDLMILLRGKTDDVCPVVSYLKKSERIHQAYFHPGGPSIEPTTTIIGRTPRDLVETVSELIRTV
jgi:predicted fused transcriptional regulator/phosphomethylpyrimidine kinase